MARRPARLRRCSIDDAAKRLEQAAAFATLAELAPDSDHGPTRSAAVSNAVLAGIVASDAICCIRIGRHASGDDHSSALGLLEQAGAVGREAVGHLRVLLGIKGKAQYQNTDPTVEETRRAMKAMRALLDLCRRA